MLGKLTIDALPFYSWVAMGGALVTVGGALAVVAGITWFGQWRTLWNDWLTSLDHKRIGIMYVTLATIMLMRGFVDAIMMRSQQASRSTPTATCRRGTSTRYSAPTAPS